jgi:hypothetical protein
MLQRREKPCHSGNRIPGRPSRSPSLYWLSYSESIYVTRRFVNVFTRARHRVLFWAELMLSTSSYSIPLKSRPRSSKFLLVLANTVILGSESHGTHVHILLSDTACNSSSVVAHVFDAAGTCLPSRCLATLGWDTQTHRQHGSLMCSQELARVSPF